MQKVFESNRKNVWGNSFNARFSKQKRLYEIIDSSFQKPIGYFIKEGPCAIWQKYLTVHKKVIDFNLRISLPVGKWWKVCLLLRSTCRRKSTSKIIWRNPNFYLSTPHSNLLRWRPHSRFNWKISKKRAWKFWQLLGLIWAILCAWVNDHRKWRLMIHYRSNRNRVIIARGGEKGKI